MLRSGRPQRSAVRGRCARDGGAQQRRGGARKQRVAARGRGGLRAEQDDNRIHRGFEDEPRGLRGEVGTTEAGSVTGVHTSALRSTDQCSAITCHPETSFRVLDIMREFVRCLPARACCKSCTGHEMANVQQKDTSYQKQPAQPLRASMIFGL
jgi:hypothetical protein